MVINMSGKGKGKEHRNKVSKIKDEEKEESVLNFKARKEPGTN